MKRRGSPLTRETYLLLAYGADLPDWGPELEEQLPPELQDLSVFEPKDQQRR